MPEKFHVLVKKFDKIDTTSTGHVLLELRLADIIVQLANLTEEAINSNLTPQLYLRPSRAPATEPSAITPDSTHRSLKSASWKRLPIMDNRVHVCVEYSHRQHDIFESLTLFPLDLSCLCIQCLVKDENDALQFKRVLDLERLHQNLVNGSHVNSRCVNSRQISGDIL